MVRQSALKCFRNSFLVGVVVTSVALKQVEAVEKQIRLPLRTPGYVSSDGLIRYEDIEPLYSDVARATAVMRSGNYRQAIAEFRRSQTLHPADPLVYRGEAEAAYRAELVPDTIVRFRNLLSHMTSDQKQKAVLHYALGLALVGSKFGHPGVIGENPQDLGPEAKQHYYEALRLDSGLVVAHLALATYYEHPSQDNGSSARKHYNAALTLRPDLAPQIRLLHALTWDRPGYMKPEELARLKSQGVDWPVDKRKMPEKSIAECKKLIQDYPDFVPAYEHIADDYEWPIGDKPAAKEYRAQAAEIKARLQQKAGK